MSLLSSSSALQGSIITSGTVHSKKESLSLYVTPKVHVCIRDGIWLKIIVKGYHTRTGPSTRITNNERHNQLFNWQRPTATPLDEDTLQINCFPGSDYVEHYARIIATYLDLNGRNDEVVIQKPAPDEAYIRFRDSSNLASMGKIKIVIIGDIHCFSDLRDVCWDGDSEDSETSLFRWKKIHQRGASSFAFLGCKVSLWGDIAGQLLMALKTLNQIEYCIYIGKAGSLRAGDVPNTQIATGTQSFIGEDAISWESHTRVSYSDIVHQGLHTTIASPLLETENWLADQLAKGVDWVDCEVGHIAQAAQRCSVSFTYFHILSDNVAKNYEFNLSNEDEAQVVTNRIRLFRELWIVLQKTLMDNFGLYIGHKALTD
jgi:hypothetical protein